MYIDTITRELMERDVAAYLDVPAEELIQYIDYAANKAKEDRWSFNTDLFNSELDAIFFDLQPENSIDKILVTTWQDASHIYKIPAMETICSIY